MLDGAFELVLLDEVPAIGGAAALQEISEGGAGVAPGGVAVALKGGEGGEVVLDGLVGGLEGEEVGHGSGISLVKVCGESSTACGGAGDVGGNGYGAG